MQQNLRKETRMKIFYRFMFSSLVLVGLGLVFLPNSGNVAMSQQPSTASAMDRGYRTGYSDGYQVGYVDFSSKAQRNFRDHPEFRSADRAYVDTYGAIEDYKDGYRQGFEAGYDAAYDRRPFESAIPANLRRHGDEGSNQTQEPQTTQNSQTTRDSQSAPADQQNGSRPRALPT